MDWIRRNAVVLIFVVAIVASFAINRADSVDRDAEQANTLVAGCVQAGTGRALLSAWQRDAAEARRAEGDTDVASDYEAYANATAASLAIARLIDDPERATEAVKVQTPDGPQFVLTEEAAALVEKGCDNQYR